MTMTMPDITIGCSRNTEAKRVIFTLGHVYDKWYQDQGFMILPYLPATNARQVVYLPKLEYHLISNLDRGLKKVKLETPPECPDDLVDGIEKMLPDDDGALEKFGKKLQGWSSDQLKNLLMTLNKVLPDSYSKLNQLNLSPTRYGTTASFSLVDQFGGKVNIYLRTDATLGDLVKALLLSLMRTGLEKKRLNWHEIEAAVNVLISETALNQFSNGKESLIVGLRSRQLAKLRKESNNYLKDLGLAKECCWSLNNGLVWFNSKAVEGLSPIEMNLLKLMIENYGHEITYDEIASVIWTNDDLYSEWAITKHIQRLRVKLKQNEIQPMVIQARRGKGYVLVG